MDQYAGLSRREALIAGAALCASTRASTVAPSANPTVNDLVQKATHRRRALRDGAFGPVAPEIASANLPLNSHEQTLEAAALSGAVAQEAKRLRSQVLSEDDRDTLECLIWDLERDANLARFYWHEFPLGYSGSQLAILSLLLPLSPTGEQEAFLRKVRQTPAYVDAIGERLRGQLKRVLTAPRAEGVRAYNQFLIEAKELTATIRRNVEAISAQPGGALVAAEAQQITDRALAGALGRLGETIRTNYIPALSEQARITRAADAPEYFRELARLRISDDLGLSNTY